MGRELHDAHPAARRTWEEAEEALGFEIRRLAFGGPKEELDDTLNAQPALLITSVAAWRVRRDAALPEPRYLAGHSLGEYTALTAAESLSFPDAVHLVRERGRLMKEAGQTNPGAMAAILGLERGAVEDLAGQAGAVLANDNCPGQIVVSGSRETVERAVALARERGGKAIPLAVSIASHSPLMGPAVEGLRRAVESVEIRPPRVPVVSNVTVRPIMAPGEIAESLVRQLTSPVRWRESVEYLHQEGCRRFLELGPGRVLSGLVKRTLVDVEVEAFG